MALLAVDDIFQCNFLPDAFSGTGGHAAAGSGLRDAVRRLEHGGLDWRLRLRAVATIAPVQRGHVHPQGPPGAGETVGRSRQAGVDAAVAGALSPLRDAAGRPIGTSRFGLPVTWTRKMQPAKNMANTRSDPASDPDSRRAASRRTALVLSSIAVAFFAGFILAQYSRAPGVGIAVLGFAILGFLIVAIGRNVRK